MEKNNKSYYWIWCLVNTILIGLIGLYVAISDDCESAQDQTIRDLMVEVQTLEKTQRCDTIIINTNSNINIPKNLKIDVTFPDDAQWIMDDPE